MDFSLSTLSIIGLVLLVAVIVAGTAIKLTMRRKLKDIDGLNSAVVTSEGNTDVIINEQMRSD